jgi:hypothetical protein
MSWMSWVIFDIIYPISRFDEVIVFTPVVEQGGILKVGGIVTRREACDYTVYRFYYLERNIVLAQKSDDSTNTRDLVFTEKVIGKQILNKTRTGYKMAIHAEIQLPETLNPGTYDVGGFVIGLCPDGVKILAQSIEYSFTIIPKK